MILRFLIDECLSPSLVHQAIRAGHYDSTCVRDRGWTGKTDAQLMRLIVAHDFTLVTIDAFDVRGHGARRPGGLHGAQPLHAGLVCLSASDGLNLDRQTALFSHALDYLAAAGTDWINRALEVHQRRDGSIAVEVYALPPA